MLISKKKKSKPAESPAAALLDRSSRDRLKALNQNESLALMYLDIEAKRAINQTTEALKDRKSKWDSYATQLLNLQPGDVFCDNHVKWWYVGYSPRPQELSRGQQIDGVAPNTYITMWVVPFETNGKHQVQFYAPRTLPLAAIHHVEVPDNMKCWVETRDPLIGIELDYYLAIDVETRVKVPISVPVATRKRRR